MSKEAEKAYIATANIAGRIFFDSSDVILALCKLSMKKASIETIIAWFEKLKRDASQ